jgi:hypothetical protein
MLLCEPIGHGVDRSGKKLLLRLSKMEIVQHETPAAAAAEIQRKKRGLNYSDEECVQICKTWLYIGEEPIQGSGQKSGAFWKRMHKHFTDNNPSPGVVRSWRSLQSKWSDIQHDTCKFIVAYATVESQDEWNTNEQDKLDKAFKLYKEQHPKNDTYDFLPCWYILRNSAKFLEYCAGEPGFPKIQDSIDAVDMVEDGAEKPLGIRSAKRQKIMNPGQVSFTEDLKKSQMKANDRKATRGQVKSAERNLRFIGEAQMMRAEAIQLQTYIALFTTPMADLDEEAVEFFRIQRAQVLEKVKIQLIRKRSSHPHTIVDMDEEPESTAQEQEDLGSSDEE